jgi:hypothetical protein
MVIAFLGGWEEIKHASKQDIKNRKLELDGRLTIISYQTTNTFLAIAINIA